MGVPREKAAEVLQRIETSAQAVGFIEDIRGKKYVSLHGVQVESSSSGSNEVVMEEAEVGEHVESKSQEPPVHSHSVRPQTALASAIFDDQRRRRVFITHGKNRNLVEPVKKLLEYGELLPVISVERQSVSKPVPEKVMDDMRSCGAAIIHVDADSTITDRDSGVEHVLLNPNVLIEIGAAMAHYGKRFILLVRDGVKLPSNLQGLYEVRYAGETLDASSTIRLLEAIKDIKNYALPTDKNGSDI